MNRIETFTTDLLPGLTGLQWGGQRFTIYSDRAVAERDGASHDDFLACHAEDETRPSFTKVVERRDGKFLLAQIDPTDDTFVYVDASTIAANL